jgi:hypothetical protein
VVQLLRSLQSALLVHPLLLQEPLSGFEQLPSALQTLLVHESPSSQSAATAHPAGQVPLVGFEQLPSLLQMLRVQALPSSQSASAMQSQVPLEAYWQVPPLQEPV